MLPQVPNLQQGEVLPNPSSILSAPDPTASFPQILPSQPPQIAPRTLAASAKGNPYEIGWGTDPKGVFSMVLQISPDSLEHFAKGQNGSELFVDIPPELRGRAERIIVRVGSGPVERVPANLSLLSRSSLNDPAQIANAFDSRPLSSNPNGTVDIDRVPSLPVSMNALPTQDILPPDRSGIAGSNGNSGFPSNPALPRANPNASLGNNLDSRPTNPNLSGVPDNFTPTVLPMNSPSNGFASNGFPNNQRDNFATSGNPAIAGLTSENQRGTLLQNDRNGQNMGSPQGQNGFPGNTNTQNPFPATNPFPDSNFNPSFAQSQVPMVMQQQQQPPLYAPIPYVPDPGMFPAGPSGRLAAAATPRSLNPGLEPETAPPAPPPVWHAWLPFTLLLSIVINVYQGMWMGHLRTRYRQLLGDLRGIPVSE